MKKYKCVNTTNGYSNANYGEIYDENHYPFTYPGSNPINVIIKQYPEDWELVVEFELPEKWGVLVTVHNSHIVNEWKSNRKPGGESARLGSYVCEDGYNADLAGVGAAGIVITTEQFKEHVLKQKDMKIIGYKLKSDCENYLDAAKELANSSLQMEIDGSLFVPGSITYMNLEKAGVLDLWFDPVYEEELKVGDWVYILSTGTSILRVGDVGVIKEFYHDDENFQVETDCCRNTNWVKSHNVRKATPQEIEAAQIKLPKINGYEGSANGVFVKYGCASLSIRKLRELLELKELSGCRNIKSITLSSDVTITMKEIEQIVKYVNAQ